jgi:hypothetical protein
MARRVPLPMMPSIGRENTRRSRAGAVLTPRPNPDFAAALVSAIALIGTVPVRVTAVWVVRVEGIRVIEWKRRKERKAEVVDKNDTVEVVMKSMVAIEVVEPSEIGCAV